MSQQPPPPPYGGPPNDLPPGGYPPFPPQGPGQGGGQGGGRPRDGMSNKAKFWIGVALSLPALVLAGIVTGAGSAVAQGVGGSYDAGATVSFVLGLMLLAGFIAAIVVERTRWFALGILAGGAILFILAAGACVVLIVAFTSSYS